jgi:ribosome small subunit-dependent GTPase A
VYEVSAKARPDETMATLKPLLAGQSSILIGQSGMGKSSLINLLVPDADIAVREISAALDTGKHTTTFTRLYQLPELGPGSSIIDSPGFQEFGLYHLSEGMLERAFVDFEPYLGALQVLQLPPPDRAAMRDSGRPWRTARSQKCGTRCTASCCTNHHKPYTKKQ